MTQTRWTRHRTWVPGAGLAAALLAAWYFSPGLPVLWGPTANADTVVAGETLFLHEWTPNDPIAHGDGLGPVYNATSCVACHFQGGVGGAGPNGANVTAFEVLPSKRDPNVHNGVVHNFALTSSLQESKDQLRDVVPVIIGSRRTPGSCGPNIPDFDPLHTDEINSPALFGVGWIDRISAKAITTPRVSRLVANKIQQLDIDAANIGAGRPRILPDGRVGKFGWKAQFATLDEFVAAACATEIGLGTPKMAQAKPLGQPSYAASPPDLDKQQFGQLVAFVDTLPRPERLTPQNPIARDQAAHGQQVFNSVGCAVCHTPDVGGVKEVYSDFLLHTIEDPPPGSIPDRGDAGRYPDLDPSAPLPEDHPLPSEWKTPPLWGVSDTAPYFHDGGSPTLQAAILRHGADARTVKKAYEKLTPEDQNALLAFLGTLKAPGNAAPAGNVTPPRRLVKK